MKKMRIVHLVVLLALLLAGSLQPANGQAPAEGSPANETASIAGSDGEITPLTIALGGVPDYDSDWTSISPGIPLTFTHNLGGASTDNYWVDLEYWNGVNGINKSYYGGAITNATHDRVGAYWSNLTTSTIKVTRLPEDPYAVKVRLRIWNQTPLSNYNHWNYLPRAISYNLNETIIDPNKHLLDLQFNDSGPYGINQRFYGVKDCGPATTSYCSADAEEGASWYGLWDAPDGINHVKIFRAKNDTSLSPTNVVNGQFHLNIWELPKPTYNSEWVDIAQGQDLVIPHNIGGNANDYVVYLEFFSKEVGIGINQLYYGGARLGPDLARPAPSLGAPEEQVGAYWHDLTNSSITVKRNPNDHYADQVRVRIWHTWKPTAAHYDSGWFTVNPGDSVVKTPFNISGGDAANYLVDLRFQNPTDGITQHNYGLNELSTRSDQGHAEDNVGAYWNHLENDSITVTRALEDTTMAQADIRIWKMPKPDYDSTWKNIPTSFIMELTHDLGGEVKNYLVDLQFKSNTYGINQGGYGGFDTGDHSITGLVADKKVGVYWSRLTQTSILVTRRPDDIFADQVRVRIWRLVNPEYDSQVAVLLNGQTTTFAHNLGQDPVKYFISTTFFNGTTNGFNQAYFGGADLLDNTRFGAYWYGLSPMRILMYHHTEDTYAGNAQVRIWVTDYAVYLPLTRK